MANTLTIHDETASGDRTHSFTLDFLDERVSVRELIRRRVYEEVLEHNAKMPEYFRGLVQPTDAERVLNGYRLRKARRIDWEDQVEKAYKAFERNGFFLLVDNHQPASLDEEIDLRLASEVSFVKLVPLVGG